MAATGLDFIAIRNALILLLTSGAALLLLECLNNENTLTGRNQLVGQEDRQVSRIE